MFLDLKDSFHQIKVHENSTKYFSLVTPDGQFEYTYLSFGYCKVPTEFQKWLIQILNPLIYRDTVIVYINDVLIPSETIEQNLEIFKEVNNGNFEKLRFWVKLQEMQIP